MAREIVDGSAKTFGPRVVETKAPAILAYSSTKELRIPINYNDLPVVSANDDLIQKIPANAWIESATLHVITPFTSGGAATLRLGLYQSDGTVIDADGIDVDIALAAINAVGARVKCDGALVNAAVGIGSAAGQLVAVEGTGLNPYTAGKALLVIRYQDMPA